MLHGQKTYIVAAALAAAGVAKALGWIDEATYQAILALLMPAGMATLAAKVNRTAKP